MTALSILGLGVGVWLVTQTHATYSACVSPTVGNGLSASADCQHSMWVVMSGVVVLVISGLALTFSLLLGRRERASAPARVTADPAPFAAHTRVANSHHPGERRAS